MSPADPDAVTTATVPAQEIMPRTTATQSSTERARVRLPETEAEEALLVQRTRTTSSAPVTTAETTSQTTTSSARTLLERTGNEVGEDSQPTQIRRIAALMTECEELSILDDTAEARRAHLEKLTKIKDRASGKSRVGTKLHLGSRVSITKSQGSTKSLGSEDFFSTTPAMAFNQSPLNPDGTESKVWNSMQMEQSRYDGCLFYRFEPSQEQVEERAGRYIYDFLVTGPDPNVEGTRQAERAGHSAFVQNRR